ncbi:MAG: hypothetical protein ACD_5C00268G0001, partial [uncultured bacterium]
MQGFDQSEKAIVARDLLNSLGENVAKATEKLGQDELAKIFNAMKDHEPYAPLDISRACNILLG